MKRIIIDEISLANRKKALFNAGSKARNDASRIAMNNGFKRVFYNTYMGPFRFLFYPFQCLKFQLKCSRCEILIQYPFVSARFLYILILLLRIVNSRVILLIHDITSVREGYPISSLEKNIFNHCNKLIVHTEAMKRLIESQGVTKCSFSILNLFDYLSESEQSVNGNDEGVIAFAGNLNKSHFLKKLGDVPAHFYLYGVSDSNVFSKNIDYLGKFLPDDLSRLRGKWGLVWDGYSIDTCDSNFGDYLKYNSPHKLSMYLAAGIPVIVWAQSALANYIVNQKLGIAVSSLRNLDSNLSTISEEKYSELVNNVNKVKDKLRQGYFLNNCLK